MFQELYFILTISLSLSPIYRYGNGGDTENLSKLSNFIQLVKKDTELNIRVLNSEYTLLILMSTLFLHLILKFLKV